MEKNTKRKAGSYPAATGHKGGGSGEIHGLYRKIDLATLDGRTILGRAAKEIKADLQAFVGAGSIITELLITQIVYKTLRLKLYQGNNFNNPIDFEAAHFLPLANSLRLDLQELAKQAGQAKPPSLDDYLAGLQEAGK